MGFIWFQGRFDKGKGSRGLRVWGSEGNGMMMIKP